MVVILKNTGAIGDAIISAALIPALKQEGHETGLVSAGFTLGLWNGFDGTSTYESVPEDIPEGAVVADISDYLVNMPHTKMLPAEFAGEERMGHLSEWMAYRMFQQTGIKLPVSRDNVKIPLTEEEIKFGEEKIHRLSKENSGKKVVIWAIRSATKNRNVPSDIAKQAMDSLDYEAVSYLLDDRQEPYVPGTPVIGDRDLRKASAIAYAADAYVGVDSGPLHMVNGALQGAEYSEGINTNPNKIIVVLGSSHPDAVTYRGNTVFQTDTDCKVAPCGAHGYESIAQYTELFGTEFFPSGSEKDKSGCMHELFKEQQSVSCMRAFDSSDLVDRIKMVLK